VTRRHRGALGAWLSKWLALLSLVGLGTVCAIVYAATAWSLGKRQDDEMARKQGVVVHLLQEARAERDVQNLRHELEHYFAAHPNLLLVLRQSDEGILFATKTEPFKTRTRQVRFTVPWGLDPGGFVQGDLIMDTSADDLLLERLLLVILTCVLLGTAAVSAGSFWLVRRAFAPVRQLAEQTHNLSADDLSVRLDGVGQADELQPLIGQFNGLLDRLERAYAQLEGFNADVAHELRTPLATLIGQSELAISRPRSAEDLKDVIASNLEELQRLAAIVNDVLFLAHADRGAKARRTHVQSLAAVASSVADFHDAPLLERHLLLKVNGDAAAAVDVGLLQRAVSNLLSNATRYAAPHSTIEVNVQPQGTEVSLTVTNSGAGIPEEQLALIFNRFHQVESCRASGDLHHGLGLAIVAAIARMHGGNTFAQSVGGRTSVGMCIQSQ
jgi:two-component system heavy metal sensor histidine kinase CusS